MSITGGTQVAVSKRLRFEILRRDNHACRYCGARAPEVRLVVDHVVPEALGGATMPENLVAACEPCNGGKASTAPNSPLVADVKRDALRWATAIRAAGMLRVQEREKRVAYQDAYDKAWSRWTHGPPDNRQPIPRPDAWRATLTTFHDYGLPIEDVVDAVEVAMGNDRVSPDNTWRYFCGVCYRVLDDIRNLAAGVVEAQAQRSDAADAADAAVRPLQPEDVR